MNRIQKLLFIVGFSNFKTFRRWVGGTWYYCWVQPTCSYMWLDSHYDNFVEKVEITEISAEAIVV